MLLTALGPGNHTALGPGNHTALGLSEYHFFDRISIRKNYFILH
jgi:hypothetical protein